ncbi:hypothetical protein [Haloactinopolyspora sp.]|nr:hypothetical protein [Haloactinopolyspora sp.]
MSIFDAGFAVWGYFVIYIALTIAYLIWMVSRNRKDTQRGATSPDRENR